MNQNQAFACSAGEFIGDHLVKRLNADRFWVPDVGLNFNKYAESEADDCVVGDLHEQSVVRSAIDRKFDEDCSLVADMGGAGCVFTVENDADIIHRSAKINLGVLIARHKRNIKRVIYSCSACI